MRGNVFTLMFQFLSGMYRICFFQVWLNLNLAGFMSVNLVGVGAGFVTLLKYY